MSWDWLQFQLVDMSAWETGWLPHVDLRLVPTVCLVIVGHPNYPNAHTSQVEVTHAQNWRVSPKTHLGPERWNHRFESWGHITCAKRAAVFGSSVKPHFEDDWTTKRSKCWFKHLRPNMEFLLALKMMGNAFPPPFFKSW